MTNNVIIVFWLLISVIVDRSCSMYFFLYLHYILPTVFDSFLNQISFFIRKTHITITIITTTMTPITIPAITPPASPVKLKYYLNNNDTEFVFFVYNLYIICI